MKLNSLHITSSIISTTTNIKNDMTAIIITPIIRPLSSPV